jgi:biotin carboxyl carrier protein
MTNENSGGSRTFNVVVDGSTLKVTVTPSEDAASTEASVSTDKSFQIEVDGRGFRVDVESGSSPTAPTLTAPSAQPTPTPRPAAATPVPQPVARPATPVTTDGETVLTAPIPGSIVRYTVAEAQPVKAGETVVVLEAMKMENTLPSPVDGVIKQIPLQAGAKVARGDVLLVIGPA